MTSALSWGSALSVARRALIALVAHSASQTLAADDGLAQDMKSRFEKQGLTVRIVGRDRLDLTQGGQNVGTVFLGNLRDICARQGATACEDAKVRRVQGQREATGSDHDRVTAAQVRAVVRPTGYLRAVEEQMLQMSQGKTPEERHKLREGTPISRSLGPDFVVAWVQDTGNNMLAISASSLKASGLSQDELERVGTANLRHEQIRPLVADANHPGIYVAEGNDYLSSVLIDEPFWQRVAGPLAAKDVSVCMPARHELFVYVPSLDPKGRVNFTNACRALAQNAAPTFSDRVVRRVNGRWLFH